MKKNILIASLSSLICLHVFSIVGPRTALMHKAVKSGNLKGLKILLTGVTNINKYKDSEGRNLLANAVRYGKEDIVIYIIENKNKNNVAINDKDNNGRTPIFYIRAWAPKGLTFLEYLLRLGAKLYVTDNAGKNILHQVCSIEIPGKGFGYSDRFMRVGNRMHNRIKVVKYLVDTYPKLVTQQDNDQRYPLYWAVKSGMGRIIKLIVEGIKDPVESNRQINSKDRDGISPIEYADKYYKRSDIAKYLSEKVSASKR